MPFQLFGTAHLLALSVIVALALGVPLLPRRRSPGIVPPLAWLLGALLLAQEFAQAAWLWRSLGSGLHLLPLDWQKTCPCDSETSLG
jgi:hypothetical protein